MTIEKVGEDRFHVTEADEVALLDEEVNGTQLMGILNGKALIVTTPGYVLANLDEHGKGHRLTVSYSVVP